MQRKMQRGFIVLDIVVALGIIGVIIAILMASNGAIFAIQKDNNDYYKAMKHFSNHLESLYDENWDNLSQEENKYFKCFYSLSHTDYNTVQLKVVGEINNKVVEVLLEKPALKESYADEKPIAVITMWPDTNITDETVISWSYLDSYDHNGYDIVDFEWKNIKTTYPVGVHVVWLRVQNSLGIWSDWVNKVFKVVSARPEIPINKIPIWTVEDLKNVKTKLDADYILMDNINLGGLNWVPIGYEEKAPFTGSLDGNGYEIRNLTINRPDNDYIGLFTRIEGAKIENIKLKNVNVIGNSRVGGLAGESYNSTITRSSVSGNLVGNHKTIGALVGEANYTAVIESSSEANVIGKGNVAGGLIGLINRCSIKDCYAVTDVVGGNNFVGGLIGRSLHSNVLNTYAAGGVIGHNHVGGLIGQSVTTNVVSSYYDKDRTGQNDTGKGEPRTNKEMKQKKTFKGWDFEKIWRIDEDKSYPYLR